MDRRKLDFGMRTVALNAIDFSKAVNATPNVKLPSPLSDGVSLIGSVGAQGQNSGLFTCPEGARAHIRGNVLGPPGGLAFLSTNAQAFTTYNSAQPHGMFPDAEAIACGERFHLVINSEQTLWGVPSGGPNLTWGQPDGMIYVSFNWEYIWYSDMTPDLNNGYLPNKGGYR